MHSIDPDSFGFLVTDVARLLRSETDRRIAEGGFDMTHGEGRALAHAARAGTVRQNVLAERMGVEAMTLSGQLDRLEARGLIRRVPDPTDRRAKLIELTDSADAMLVEIQRVASALRDELTTNFAAEDWQRFMAMLKIIRGNLSALRGGDAASTGDSAS
ncbi:MAG TPA: MarR family transcriptional regulator [Tianweitania sediminis]|jgi:DNA-binding MarR family transcriptional regulator|nr:MarR family transcriptional regulator [Tianweitania sediminis]